MRRLASMPVLRFSPFILLVASIHAAPVDFARDVQPLFAEHCLECHGPDDSKGGLVLTSSELALKALKSGAHGIVPGKPDESEMIDLQKMARLGERLYTSLLTLFGDHPIDGDGPSSITEAFEGAYNMLEHPIESVKFFAQTAEMLIKKSDYQVIDQRLEERYKLELAEFNSKLSLAQQAKTFPLKLGMPLMLIIHVILFRRINKTLLQALQMGRR